MHLCSQLETFPLLLPCTEHKPSTTCTSVRQFHQPSLPCARGVFPTENEHRNPKKRASPPSSDQVRKSSLQDAVDLDFDVPIHGSSQKIILTSRQLLVTPICVQHKRRFSTFQVVFQCFALKFLLCCLCPVYPLLA